MVNTPVELVGGTSQGIVTIHEIGIDDGPDSVYPRYVRVGFGPHWPPAWGLVFPVVEPLQGLEGLVDIGPSPATDGFGSDGIGW